MTAKKTAASCSPEVRERAVRLVLEGAGEQGSQWAAISSIAAKIGCTAETLGRWVRHAERDRMVALERENRELRQANEILRVASAYLALAELDCRSKP
jgi:transposase